MATTKSLGICLRKAQMSRRQTRGGKRLCMRRHKAAIIGFLGDLIDAGGDVNARDVSQTTPLMLAVFHGHFDCVELLADSGADVSALDRDGVSVLAQVRNGRAAVLWKRRRALRHLRDRIEHGHVDREEIDQSIEQDFEWLRSVEERYQEIQAYLSALGAKDCGTPVDLLTFPVTIRAVGPVIFLNPQIKKVKRGHHES